MDSKPSIVLEDGLDLRKVLTTGSVLHINEDYDEGETSLLSEKIPGKVIDFFGMPVKSFNELEKQMSGVDSSGFVKKKILEEGGGFPLNKSFTVYIAYSGYWESDPEPFDISKPDKPMVVDLNDNGLLPGLQIAVESMLVGETSMFLLSYKVMYGELGIPPRIKPKSNCIFYIKLLKSILTPENGAINLTESGGFDRVLHDVKLLYGSGVTLYKTKNFSAAIQSFRKAVVMLHRSRLADEIEEAKQEKMLIKLYTNLAVCYNMIKQPLKTCISCNELNRLNSLWNNGKALFQNAKALRMIGQFDMAEKKLARARTLCQDRKEIDAEFELLIRTRDSCNQSKLVFEKEGEASIEEASDAFKTEVDDLVKNFKDNVDLCKLTLPGTLNKAEMEYIKQACTRENLFLNKIQKDYALDKVEEKSKSNFQDDVNEECL